MILDKVVTKGYTPYELGEKAFENGETNPFHADSDDALEWDVGYSAAEFMAQEEFA